MYKQYVQVPLKKKKTKEVMNSSKKKNGSTMNLSCSAIPKRNESEYSRRLHDSDMFNLSNKSSEVKFDDD